MKKNELFVPNQKVYEACVAKYHKALEKCETSAWALAKTVHETVNQKNFNEAFKSQTDYAKVIGKSKAYVSQLVKAWENREILLTAERDFSLGVVQEMAKIDKLYLNEFCDDYGIDENTTAKEVRECVKSYMNDGIEEDAVIDGEVISEETVDNDKEENDKEENDKAAEDIANDFMTCNYNGNSYVVSDKKVIEKIIKLIEQANA